MAASNKKPVAKVQRSQPESLFGSVRRFRHVVITIDEAEETLATMTDKNVKGTVDKAEMQDLTVSLLEPLQLPTLKKDQASPLQHISIFVCDRDNEQASEGMPDQRLRYLDRANDGKKIENISTALQDDDPERLGYFDVQHCPVNVKDLKRTPAKANWPERIGRINQLWLRTKLLQEDSKTGHIWTDTLENIIFSTEKLAQILPKKKTQPGQPQESSLP
jgi:hypothetical protein